MKALFSVLDSKSGTYGAPFSSISDGTATRDFQHVVNDPATLFCNHSSDFSLYRVGEFDEDTGLVSGYPVPQFVVNASALKGGE